MKKIQQFFKPAGVLRSLAECLVLGLVLIGLLPAIADRVENFLITNGMIFFNAILSFWLAIRLRLPKGKWGRKLGLEVVYAILLTLLIAVLIPMLLLLVGLSPYQSSMSGIYVFWSLAISLFYLVFRAVRYVWCWWQGKRKQRLIWDLMHIQLSMAALVAVTLIFLGGISIIWNADRLYPYDTEGPLVSFVLRMVETVFPYLGITLAITIGVLVLLLLPAALISYLSVKRFTSRFDHLANATRQIRQGDYDARAEVAGEDEIAQLQQDFNAMAADLQGAITALGEERDKVAQLLDSRRQLMANASHELRTPVATIQAYLDSMAERSDLSPEIASDLETVQNEIRHLSRLIDDLFTLSRAEVGALEIVLVPTAVSTLVRRVVGAFQALAWQASKVAIVVESETDPMVEADPDRLEQVIANLLRNAINHTPPGGIISVVVEEVDEQAVIHVRDTGEGIASEELPHIWERFYRGSNEGSHEHRGAGLGLALVRELVTGMGGEITVTSQPDLGTEFIIRFNLLQGDHREKTSQQV
jgi:signal transduction histidine kinase